MSKKLDELFEKYPYDTFQKNELRIADENNLDISLMADRRYDWEQMHEIRLCLKAHIDPSPLLDYHIASEQMKKIREELFKKDAYFQKQHEFVREKHLKTTIISSIVIGVVLCLIFIVLWKREMIITYIKTINLELKKSKDKIGLSKANSIDYMSYVKNFDNSYKIFYKAPTITKVGTYSVEYTISNSAKKATRYLSLTIYDDIKPKINLKNTNITLNYNTSFNAKSYIKDVSDETSSLTIDDVTISNPVRTNVSKTYTVIYTLQDENKNTTTEKLNVTVKQEEKKNTNTITYTTNSEQTVRKPQAKKRNAISKIFYFSDTSDMNATYSKATNYAENQLNNSNASSYNVTPITNNDGIYIGYKVTFS